MTLHDQRTLLLHPSKWRMTTYLLVGLALTSAGVYLVIVEGTAVAWLVLLFGLSSLFFAVQFLPGASYLRLGPDGFVVGSLFRRRPLIPWGDVSEFRVASVPASGMRMVVFDCFGGTKPRLSRISRVLVGANAGFHDSYGLKPDELAELLNTWRARAVAAGKAEA